MSLDPVAPSPANVGPWTGVAIGSVLLAPLAVWSFLDRAPFGGDESQYARGSLELWQALGHAPAEWPARMLDVMSFRPPGLVWIGQLFVPLAPILGGVERALRLAVWLLALGTVALVHATLARLAAGRAAAIGGALLVAASPLGFRMGGQFLVEPLQMLVVAWFLLILARATDAPPARTMIDLGAASAAALMAKSTTPVLVALPAAVALALAVVGARRRGWGWRRAGVLGQVAVALPLIGATAWFYTANWALLATHFRANTVGAQAVLWGRDAGFVKAALFWLDALAGGLMWPGTATLVGLALAAALVVERRRRRRATDPFARFALVCGVQIVTTIAVFSSSAMRQERFLLPLLPPVAILAGWAIDRRPARWPAWPIVGAFALQLGLVATNAFDPASALTERSRPIDFEGADARLLAEVVRRTCPAAGGAATVVASEGFRGSDWFAPEPANFVVAQRRVEDPTAPLCRYEYLGGSFFGQPIDKAWRDLATGSADYVVAVDPALHPPLESAFNRGLDRTGVERLWRELERSEVFVREPPLAGDNGVTVFRRARGRVPVAHDDRPADSSGSSTAAGQSGPLLD